jgi:hypothetical protein
MRIRALVLTVLAAAVFTHAARAQETTAGCPPISGGDPSLADVDTEERLRFIRERLAHEAGRARVWSEVWSLGWGLLTGAQLALIPIFDDEGTQVDMLVGAGSSAIGLAGQLLLPLKVKSDQPRLEEHLAGSAGDPDRCALLRRAEEVFIQDAENEAEGKSWLMHGANVLVNTGVLLILGLGFDRWESGAINAAAGLVLGETMILTQPAGLEDDLERYRKADLSAPGEPRAGRWGLMPVFSQNDLGIALTVSF